MVATEALRKSAFSSQPRGSRALIRGMLGSSPFQPCLAGAFCFLGWGQAEARSKALTDRDRREQAEAKAQKEPPTSQKGPQELAENGQAKLSEKEPSQEVPKLAFQPRSEEEVKQSVDTWAQHLHSRAHFFFEDDEEKLWAVLESLARATDRRSDPVLNHQCSLWHGDVKDSRHAAIKVTKPGTEEVSVTYVNRVLIFLFASDDSFERWLQLPKQPFKMRCGDQLCASLCCIEEECHPV